MECDSYRCLQSLALVVAGASKVQRRDEKYIRAVMSILLKRHSGARQY
jgi:hypothetical protein